MVHSVLTLQTPPKVYLSKGISKVGGVLDLGFSTCFAMFMSLQYVCSGG